MDLRTASSSPVDPTRCIEHAPHEGMSMTPPPPASPAPWRATPRQWMALNVLFWTAVALLYATQWALRGRVHDPTALWHLTASNLVSFVPCALLAPLIAVVTTRYPILRGPRGRTLMVHTAGLLGFIVVAGALMGALDWILPWREPGHGVLAAAAAGIYFYLAPDTLFYVIVVAFVSATTHARESNDRSIDQARLRAQLAEAQLNVLSMQLQPHFLFNTLNAISALTREQPGQAERLLARLSELLRYSLETTSRSTTLAEEFAIVTKYIEIQQARYGPRLTFRCALEAEVRDTPVPPLLLQPLVENAIRHGIAQCPTGGTVTVSATREGDVVHLRVEDDGLGLPTERAPREGIGVASTRARLDQLYGDAYTLTLANRPTGGTTCRITLAPGRAFARGVSSASATSPRRNGAVAASA